MPSASGLAEPGLIGQVIQVDRMFPAFFVIGMAVIEVDAAVLKLPVVPVVGQDGGIRLVLRAAKQAGAGGPAGSGGKHTGESDAKGRLICGIKVEGGAGIVLIMDGA